MSEIKTYNRKLKKIGEMLKSKRLELGESYKNREEFIDLRKMELFGDQDWMSPRHLASIELGNNWISIEKLILLSSALEQDPVDLFAEIVRIYQE